MATKKRRRRETSKDIVVAVLVIFAVAMVAAYTLPILFDYIQDTILQIFKTVSTLTGSV